MRWPIRWRAPTAAMAACLAATALGFAAAAHAQEARARTEPRDCSKVPNPVLCAQHQRVQRACGELKGEARRDCRERLAPIPNCNRALDRRACAAHLMAHEVCRGHEGAAFRDCMKVSPGAEAAR